MFERHVMAQFSRKPACCRHGAAKTALAVPNAAFEVDRRVLPGTPYRRESPVGRTVSFRTVSARPVERRPARVAAGWANCGTRRAPASGRRSASGSSGPITGRRPCLESAARVTRISSGADKRSFVPGGGLEREKGRHRPKQCRRSGALRRGRHVALISRRGI